MEPKRITRQIRGGYFQDASGDWWLVNPQTGWVKVLPAESRALRFYLDLAEKEGW